MRSLDYCNRGVVYCDEPLSKSVGLMHRMHSIEIADDEDSRTSLHLKNSCIHLAPDFHSSQCIPSPGSTSQPTSHYVASTSRTSTAARHVGFTADNETSSAIYGAQSELSQFACKSLSCNCSKAAYNTISVPTQVTAGGRMTTTQPIQLRKYRMHIYESPQLETEDN